MYVGYEIKENIKVKEIYGLCELWRDKTYKHNKELNNFWECIFILDGVLNCTVESKKIQVSKGDFIFLKPFETFNFYVESDEPAHIFLFSFDAQDFHPYISKIQNTLNPYQTSIINLFLEFLHGSKQDCTSNEEYESYLHELKEPLFSQTVLSYILLFLNSVTDANFIVLQSPMENHINTYNHAIEFMNANIFGSISVPEICEHCHISLSSLKRIFNIHAGMGIHEYFIRLKLQHATKMLQGDYSIAEISNKLDFCSQEHFSRIFKKIMGITPKYYQQLYKNENNR